MFRLMFVNNSFVSIPDICNTSGASLSVISLIGVFDYNSNSVATYSKRFEDQRV